MNHGEHVQRGTIIMYSSEPKSYLSTENPVRYMSGSRAAAYKGA